MRRVNLTVSILAFLSCLMLLTWLLFSLLAYKTTANDLYSQKAEHARMLLATFIQQLPNTIPTIPSAIIDSNSPAATFARNISTDKSFVRLTILNSNDKPVFTVGRDGGDIYGPFFQLPNTQDTGCSFNLGEVRCIAKLGQGTPTTQVATAGLSLSMKHENSRLARSRTLYMAYFAIDFILLVGLGAFILSHIVVTPLHQLLAATEKITGGQYGQRIRVSGSLELAVLAESFNTMSTALMINEQQVAKHVAAIKQANLDLEQAREETIRTEKMASIGLLAAGMAHEIGTPLAAITGYAELAANEEIDTATIQEYARRISNDCNRIDKIVRGLLQYARQQGNVVEKCHIKELLEETVELLKEQGVFKNVHISFDCDPDLIEAAASPHQLQQVLINFFINSRDAMPNGGELFLRATKEINIKEIPTSKYFIKIELNDNGIGIPPENIKKIFDPFFTTKEPGKGTGLGLAISARIIEGFGGRISVASQVGKGTQFSIWLPGATP